MLPFLSFLFFFAELDIWLGEIFVEVASALVEGDLRSYGSRGIRDYERGREREGESYVSFIFFSYNSFTILLYLYHEGMYSCFSVKISINAIIA